MVDAELGLPVYWEGALRYPTGYGLMCCIGIIYGFLAAND
jgi:hypothetical protein